MQDIPVAQDERLPVQRHSRGIHIAAALGTLFASDVNIYLATRNEGASKAAFVLAAVFTGALSLNSYRKSWPAPVADGLPVDSLASVAPGIPCPEVAQLSVLPTEPPVGSRLTD